MKDFVIKCRWKAISGVSTISYFVDWVILITIVMMGLFFIPGMAPKYHQFHTDDISLQFAYVNEADTAVPTYALIILSVMVPAAQFVAMSLFSSNSTVRKLWDIHCGLKMLCGAHAVLMTVTNILKNVCGLPRPDLIARCVPFTGYLGMLGHRDCTTANKNCLDEGFRSFPSGHLLAIFCGMVLCHLNMCANLQVYDFRNITGKQMVTILPLLVAVFTAATRISDNRHFLRDVVTGACLGTLSAWWFYQQHFPCVGNLRNCGRAFPPRRFGVSKFFGNQGGLWSLNDSIPGSLQPRCLDTEKIIEKLGQKTGLNLDNSSVEAHIRGTNALNEAMQRMYDLDD